MRTVLVTGATGFIGRHLVDGLLARGAAVRALVRSAARADHLQRDGVELVGGSLGDVAGWRAALAGCDAVVNCAGLTAAPRRSDLAAVNGDAVGALADACTAGDTPPVLVHLSSLAAAGPVARRSPPRDEADPPRPISAYGTSKLRGDGELRSRAGRLPITIVRPGIVFGPYETHFAAMFQSIRWTRLHAMMGACSPALSLVHVADLVPLVLAAAERGSRLQMADEADAGEGAGVGRGIYHAADDREFPTHAQLGRRLARALGTSALVLPLPVPLVLPVTYAIEKFWNLRGQPSIVSPDKLREATAPSWAASAARARRELGFAPAATLDERLAETARWLQANGRL